MKKTDLKQILKPIVKECITEVLLEEGLLSNVVSEVARGLQSVPATDPSRRRAPAISAQEAPQTRRQPQGTNIKLQKHRQKMLEAVGADAYNGVNLFEGTDPLSNDSAPQGHADLGKAADAGVDITSIVGKSSAIWQALK